MPKTDTLAPAGVGIRHASPVMHPDGAGVVDEIDGGTAWCTASEGAFRDYAFANVCLRLSDPTGQAHAVWWIAERFGDASCTATLTFRGLWDLDLPQRRISFTVSNDGRSWMSVPALADIDPNDRAGAIAAIMRKLVEVTNAE